MADPKEPDEDDEISLPEDGDEGQEQQVDARSIDDAGGADDSRPEGSEGEAEEGQVAEEAARPLSRGERHYGKLRSEVRSASERAERLERELNELRQRQQQPQQPTGPREETEQEFHARLALMTAEERIDARLTRSERRHQQEMLMLRMQTADQSDRARFDGLATQNPIFKRVQNEVEQLLQFERRRGRDFDRETVAYFLLGKKVAESKGKVAQAQTRGQQNIARQTTRPDQGRSDVRPQRRENDPRGVLERRLQDVEI